MSETTPPVEEEFDPTEDPTKGHLEATEFPEDEVPDPEQTPEDLGTDDADDEEES